MSFARPPFPVVDAAGELVAAIDWLGQEFRVGDQVMYCVTASPGGHMAIGRVRQLVHFSEVRGNGREPWEEIRVQVLTERTSGGWDTGPRSRPAWVTAANITAYPSPIPVVA